MTPSYLRCDELLNLVQALPHQDRITPDHYHPDIVLLSGASDLCCLIEHNIHKLVVSSKCAGHDASRIKLEFEPFLHELPEIWTRALFRV